MSKKQNFLLNSMNDQQQDSIWLPVVLFFVKSEIKSFIECFIKFDAKVNFL